MTFATLRARGRRPVRLLRIAAALAVAVLLPPSPAAANDDDIYIVQTNAAGDNVHVIDPATNAIVAEITGVEVIHGVAAAPRRQPALPEQTSRRTPLTSSTRRPSRSASRFR